MPVNYDGNNYFAQSNGRTLNLHLNREPRFFAWIAFHNGNYEIMKYNGKVVNTNNAKKAIVVKFRKNDANGWEDGHTTETHIYFSDSFILHFRIVRFITPIR